MEKRVLEDLISVTTRSSDKNTILKALIKLRAEVVKDKHGIQTFYNAGGIAPMVRLLSKPYEKILEVALSILGNCCTQSVCSKQAISHGIVPPLLTILKSIPNPKVQCRVCRLLGNLARESNEKLCTLAKGIGVVVASILEDTKDVATLSMAIRATRLLWSEMPFYDEFVRSEGIEKMLGILIKTTIVEPLNREAKSIVEQNPYEKERVEFMETNIPHMETINSCAFDHEILKKSKPVDDEGFQIPNDPEQHNLLIEMMKCLEIVTSVPTLRIIYSFIRNQDSGSCITFFARNNSPYRTHSLRILSNLAKSNGKKILNDADAMKTICNLITTTSLEKPLSVSEERYCICVICYLADDACNRAKVRKSGAFKYLLQVAKNTTNDSLLSMILVGLQHFRYDNMSTDLMIRMGLLSMLINRLQANIKDLKESHNINYYKREDVIVRPREMDDDEMDGNFPKRIKMEFSPPRFISDSPTMSASSSSVYYSSSPCSSPSNSSSPRCLSPANRDCVYDDFDDYSPVVSDIEDQNEDDPKNNKIKRTPKDEIDKDNSDILQQILNEQSSSKCELEEENVSDQEHDEAEDIKEKKEKEKEPSSSDVCEKKRTIHLVLSILISASYRLKQMPNQLCKPEILDILVKTCRLTYKRRSLDSAWDSQGAPVVLSQIIKPGNFVALLKSEFIFQVYDLANPSKEHQYCDLCTDLKHVGDGLLNLLTETAESGYGRGEMVNFLLKDDKQMHKQVSIISAMIIRDKKNLHDLLIKHGGLYTMTELISTKNERLSKEAAIGLTALARTLDIQTLQKKSKRIPKFDIIVDGSDNDDSNIWDDEEDLVLFVSGENVIESNERNSVKFSEQILTENSDVFNRMFNSNFKESKNKQVVIKDQSIAGIRYFLDSIKQYSKGKSLRKPVQIISSSDNNCNNGNTLLVNSVRKNYFKAALEAYDMCQIYLLPELEKEIHDMITYLLGADNIVELFIFSVRKHKQELTEMSINYYLTSNFSGEQKVNVFRAADDSDYCKEWNDLILDTVAYICQNSTL